MPYLAWLMALQNFWRSISCTALVLLSISTWHFSSPCTPFHQCSFYCNSMTAVAFPIVLLNNRNKIPWHCNRIRGLVVELFFFFIAALLVLSIPKEARKPSVNTFQRCFVLQVQLLGTCAFSIIWIWMTNIEEYGISLKYCIAGYIV